MSGDLIDTFIAALPKQVAAHVTRTQAVVALVSRAVNDHGWHPAQLAAECSRDLGDARNIGGIVTDRLSKAATRRPAYSSIETDRARSNTVLAELHAAREAALTDPAAVKRAAAETKWAFAAAIAANHTEETP